MTTRTVTPSVRLQPGDALHLPLDTRTTLYIAAGSVVLHEPLRWLADTVVAPAMRLSEGDCHCVAHNGWVEVRAGSAGAEVRSERHSTGRSAGWPAIWRPLKAIWPSGRQETA